MSLDRARSLTVAQVAMVCGVEQVTVRSWINRGNLARNKHGRIDPRELVRYLDERGDRGQRKSARRFGYRPAPFTG